MIYLYWYIFFYVTMLLLLRIMRIAKGLDADKYDCILLNVLKDTVEDYSIGIERFFMIPIALSFRFIVLPFLMVYVVILWIKGDIE